MDSNDDDVRRGVSLSFSGAYTASKQQKQLESAGEGRRKDPHTIFRKRESLVRGENFVHFIFNEEWTGGRGW